MHKQRAFTMIELLVVIAIIAVLIGLIFPAIGAIKRSAREKDNNIRVRGIVQGMITFSGSHRDFFPGFDGINFTQDNLATTGNSGFGQDAEARYWILLDGNYTSGDQVISPSEERDPWNGGVVTSDNYSFAMLQIALRSGDPLTAPNKVAAYRREEWRNQQNPLAPVMNDRLLAEDNQPEPGITSTYLSVHDGSTEGDWFGTIAYGDLSVEFSSTPIVETRFSDYRNDEDDIFNAGDGSGGSLNINKNAASTYHGTDQPFDAEN